MGLKPRRPLPALEPFLSSLPGKVQRWIVEALTAADATVEPIMGEDDVAGLKITAMPARTNEVSALFDKAFDAVGYPVFRARVDGQWTDTPIPVPSQLTDAQRALVEIVARVDGVPISNRSLPHSGWCRRRWLGIDPPGVLEREIVFDGETVPLWRALSVISCGSGPSKRCKNVVDSLDLSLVDRLELLTDTELNAYRIRSSDCLEWGSMGTQAADIGDIDASCADWALRTADRLVALFGVVSYHPDRGGHVRPPAPICWPLVKALLASGEPWRPEWDGLVHLAYGPPEVVELSRAVLRAIPADRRDDVFVNTLRVMLPVHGIRTALALLDEFPSTAVAQYVLDRCGDVSIPKRQILTELEALAARHAEIRAPLSAFLGVQPARVELTRGDVLKPASAGELTPLQKRQLEHAGKLWDGQQYSAEERLSFEGSDQHPGGQVQSFLGFLDILGINDASGKPAYDAFLYMVDSGTIYRAGTLDVVAEIVQFGIECEDPALKEALQVALKP